MRGLRWSVIALVATLTACGGGGDDPDAPATIDGGPDARVVFDNLSETGLCADPACTTILPEVHAYQPRWELWADTATKRRWIYIPAGSQIDTSNMDYWVFPQGTKLWKEFSRDGTRVETRLIQKIGPTDDDWYFTPYIWNAAQDSAVSTPEGMNDANGTSHDVPTRPQCKLCHEAEDGRVLGFGAIQLDFAGAAGDLDLDDVIAMGWLSVPPPGTASPRFPIPGAPGEQAALGYFHANCGHCHNPTSSTFRDITNIDLRLQVGLLATAGGTPAYTSTINIPGSPPVNGATVRVQPHSLTGSILYQRFSSTEVSVRMPKLGTEMIDPTGDATISAWINALP